MTDLYNRSLPFSQDRYRHETERRNSMLGAGRTPKKTKCVRCETWRTSETWTMTGKGFVCHGCGTNKTEKSAAASADVKTAASLVR